MEKNTPVLRMELFFDGEGNVPNEEYIVKEFENLHDALHKLKENLTSKSRPSLPLTGWCSWYQYFEEVSEECILETKFRENS